MKSALIMIMILGTSSAFSMSLSYKDHVEVKKTIKTTKLPAEYLKLHRNFIFEGERMIAGEFESHKPSTKKTYMDGLRSRLEGCKGLYRF